MAQRCTHLMVMATLGSLQLMYQWASCFMAKYVKTEAQMEELDPVTGTWGFTHRGPFSVLRWVKKMGNTKVMKNVATTSVLRWGRLSCMWEGGDRHDIESRTLNTMGLFDMTDDSDSPTNMASMPILRLWDVAARLLKPILHEYSNCCRGKSSKSLII